MFKYNYVARDTLGNRIVGTEEAQNEDEVISRLQARDIAIISITLASHASAAGQVISRKQFKFAHWQIKSLDLVNFARQLATMLSAGVSVLKSLEVISPQLDSRRLHGIVDQIVKDIKSGFSLHKAFAKHSAIFSNLWINLIETGEASGNLPIVLDRLANYLETQEDFKRRMLSAMIYPFIIFFAAIFALLFFILKIIPMFSNLYKDLGAKMPPLTQAIMDFSAVAQKMFLPLLIIAFFVFVFLKQYLKTGIGKRNFDYFKLNLPIAGEIFKNLAIENFTSEMATLVESGVPILYALEIAERSAGNVIMQDAVRKIKENVRDGKLLAEPLEKSGLFPPMVVQMVSIGEEIGELSKMFKRLALYYAQTVETFITRFASIFEPILLVFVGVIIGFLVISMFLPIFSIASLNSTGG